MLEAAQRETGLTGQKARDLLGGFLFSGADVEKSLDDISGGEQRRLSLAILVASGANVLILDEPTNHLDIESREALEDALSAFEGAVILVSHDRALLEAVGSRTLVCEDGELQSHPSGWAEYQRRRDEREEAAAAAAAAAKRSSEGRASAPAQAPLPKSAARRASRLAEKIEAAEAELREVEEELADPAAWSTPAQRRARRRAPRGREAQACRALRAVGGGRAGGQRSGRSSLTRVPLPGARVMLRTLTLSGLGSGRAEVGALDELAQDDPHLVFGEGGADAAPHAAAERDPGVVVGLFLEEALGPELLRLGEEVLAVVQGGDRRHHEGAGLQLVAADRGRCGQLAGDVDDHRARSQRLFHRRVEVLVLARGDATRAASPARAACAAAAPSPRPARSRSSRGRRRAP